MQKQNINNSSTKTVNSYSKEWKRIENIKEKPRNYRKLVSVEHKEFIAKILEQNPSFVQSIVESIYNGDLYLLKNALSKKKVQHVIEAIHKFNRSCPSTFHKILEGVPNFHRWIGQDLIDSLSQEKRGEGTYCIKHIKHATYMFTWNDDISGVRNIIMEACRPLKLLAGLSLDEFTNNTPKDNQIERVQVARYPPSGGYIEPHRDPPALIRFIISGYLGKRGADYQEGGFFLNDEKHGKLDMEKYIDAGDVGFFYSSLIHGVDPIDTKKPSDINKKDGRWWFGLNMHNSNIVKPVDRIFGAPHNLKAKN